MGFRVVFLTIGLAAVVPADGAGTQGAFGQIVINR
tara:strand:+ start:116 stop:220 length:105 start_codon:yes stop_codon:yes gene_type:complete